MLLVCEHCARECLLMVNPRRERRVLRWLGASVALLALLAVIFLLVFGGGS